jgi:NADH-quinone oxidoreductase subunit L
MSHHEQDISTLGGLRKLMPVTFATYAVGMMALSGVPLFFSGFWSKDEILHRHLPGTSPWPFYLTPRERCSRVLLTRQMFYVFFGERRDHRTRFARKSRRL